MAKRMMGEILPTPVLWSYSANKGGLHPVKLRVTHQRKAKYYAIYLPTKEKLFLSSSVYDMIESTPLQKLRGDNRALKGVINRAVQSAQDAIEAATNKGKTPFSFAMFERKYLGVDAGRGLLAYFKNHIDALIRNGQAGTARAYGAAFSSFKKFQNDRDLDPAALTTTKLNDFDQWLREGGGKADKGKTDTSISIYMRCLRSIYNAMAADDEYLMTIYPFSRSDRDKLKYKIPSSTGQKGQTLTVDELRSFIDGKIDGQHIPENPMYRAKQLFLFSFFCQGINFRDLALLKYKNIENGIIEFERQKTIRTTKEPRKVRVPLTKELEAILIEQGNPENNKENYVFGVFDSVKSYTPKEIVDKALQWIKVINKGLRIYCEHNKIKVVSTYASRHTFGSLAKSHLSVAMISEMLGHARISTTQAYLGRFEDGETRTGLMKVFKSIKKKSA